MDEMFQSKCVQGSRWGLLVVDAKNVFNMANRQMELGQARCYWPKASRYLYNTYRGNADLIIRDNFDQLSSKGGVIQGDPMSMPLYAIATLPLIKSLLNAGMLMTLLLKVNLKTCWNGGIV